MNKKNRIFNMDNKKNGNPLQKQTIKYFLLRTEVSFAMRKMQ